MTTMTNWTPDKIAELVDRGRRMANGPEPHGYDYAVFIGVLVDALEATTDTIVASQGRIAELETQIDPPVCRLQFPDGSVPGNAREAAEGWHRLYVELLSDTTAQLNAGSDALRQTSDLLGLLQNEQFYLGHSPSTRRAFALADRRIRELEAAEDARVAEANGPMACCGLKPSEGHNGCCTFYGEDVRAIMAACSRRPHPDDPKAGRAAVELIREIERVVERARDRPSP